MLCSAFKTMFFDVKFLFCHLHSMVPFVRCLNFRLRLNFVAGFSGENSILLPKTPENLLAPLFLTDLPCDAIYFRALLNRQNSGSRRLTDGI